jgi:CTP:molybdopterin cytidylyltransferase MocA
VTVACTVLAAGASRRLGRPKQLLSVHGSSTLVRWSLECACSLGCGPVSVTVGAGASAVTEALSRLPIEVIGGFDWREGIAASIRAATSWALARGAGALLICVCDQPLLSSRHLRRLLAASAGGARLAASRYAGAAGVPAVFPAHDFGALLSLRGDAGAGAYLRHAAGVALVPWPDGELDVDTPDDLGAAYTA